MRNIGFLIDSSRLLAIKCIVLLESQSIEISSVDPSYKVCRFAFGYKLCRSEINNGLNLSKDLIDLR